MGLDFFGVQLGGQIETFPSKNAGDSQIVDLWVGKLSGEYESLGALSYVSQINVEMRLSYTQKIQLVLTPPFEEGLKFLNSRLIHFGVGRLFVQFGYSTGVKARGFTGVFSGLLQKPDVRIGQDISITLNALGVGYAMNITGGSTDSPNEFEGLSWAGAVEKVLSKYAKVQVSKSRSQLPAGDRAKIEKTQGGMLDLSGLYTDFTNAERSPTEKGGIPFFKNPPVVKGTGPIGPKKTTEGDPPPVPSVKRGARNDWWFVREAVQNFGLQMFFESEGKVRITDQSRWMGAERNKSTGGANKKPRKVFLLRGNVFPQGDPPVFPILSFSSPTTGVWMSPGIGKIVAQEIRKDKRRALLNRRSVDASDTATGASKDGWVDTTANTPASSQPQDAAKNLPGDPRDAATIQKMKAEWKKLGMDGGVTMRINTIGVPDLAPGEIIQLAGFQEFGVETKDEHFFNGPAGVIQVRHSVGVGGFMTQFTCVSNWFPLNYVNSRKLGNPEGIAKSGQPEGANKEPSSQEPGGTVVKEPKDRDAPKNIL